MRNETTTYHCDKCGKKLKTCDNSMNIVTSLSESLYWSRLHVQITRIHGMHNDENIDQAELCKSCAVGLLTDALKRVKAGERATAGTETSEQGDWE
jgi:hypothetical protein